MKNKEFITKIEYLNALLMLSDDDNNIGSMKSFKSFIQDLKDGGVKYIPTICIEKDIYEILKNTTSGDIK